MIVHVLCRSRKVSFLRSLASSQSQQAKINYNIVLPIFCKVQFCVITPRGIPADEGQGATIGRHEYVPVVWHIFRFYMITDG